MKKTKYQVWGYDSKRNDFTFDLGVHDDLHIAIPIADFHSNTIVEQYDMVYDENGELYDASNYKIVYRSFDSDESEEYFKRNFPHLF